ncbi:hypothetical protein EDB84DRAFT_1566247 [Lactarius hengduanensis]|nr:hypothetical protein EDB84DRAFT_1566247 [Lactarius hengduanensis]
MAARSSCQLPLAWLITRDCDGLWKDIRRTGPESVRQSVTISLWEVLSLRCQVWSLPPVRGRTISASVTSRETHRLIGPTSTILPSPDTTDRHPFYAFSFRPTPRHLAFHILPARRHAPLSLMSPPPRSTSRRFSPQLLGVCGRSLWPRDLYGKCCSTATSVGVGPELAHRRKLLIGSLNGPSPHSRRRVADLASVLVYLATISWRSRTCAKEVLRAIRDAVCLWLAPVAGLWPSPRRAIAHVCGRRMSYRDYARAKRMLRAVLIRLLSDNRSRASLSDARHRLPYRKMNRIRVVYDWDHAQDICIVWICVVWYADRMNDFGNHIRWAILISASAWLTVSATTVPGLQSLLVYSFPLSVRVARGDFPSALRECIMLMTSSVVDVVGEQQAEGISRRFRRHNFASVHTIKFERLHAYAETVDEVHRQTILAGLGSISEVGKVADVSALSALAAVSSRTFSSRKAQRPSNTDSEWESASYDGDLGSVDATTAASLIA